MKLIILAALVASISAAGWFGSSDDETNNQVFPTEYESGKEYVYKYESQVLTSLPSFTKSHGGIKIVSNQVKIDFTSSNRAVLQMTDIQLLSLNHEIGDPADLPPTRQLPTNRFTPLPSQDATKIREKLELPVKFKYENGKVTSLEVTDQETNWSIDLKRSILSMFQIRLQADSSSSYPNLSYNNLEQDNNTAFSFLEPALDGTCYSGITVQRPLDATDANQYKIRKTRDPVDCVKQNSLFKVTWPQNLEHCECQPNLNDKKEECTCKPQHDEYRQANPTYFDAKTLSEYDVVSSDRENLVIKSCVQSATYRYEFPNSPDQYLATFSNQTLTFRQQKDDQSIPVRSYTFRRAVNQPWKQQILNQEDEQLMMSSEEIIKQAKQLINEMVTLSSDRSRFDDHLVVFYQLVENLRLFNKDQLQKLFREYNVNDQYRNWKVMVDALAHCNTTVCDKFLLEKMVSGVNTFPPTESTSIFMVWAQNKVPTLEILDEFKKTVIPTLERNNKQKMAYQHSLLCFGSLIRRFIHSEEMQKRMCALEADKQLHQKHIEACRKYEEVIEGKLNENGSDEEKIFVLKALTNLGSIESLEKIQKLLANNQNTVVRVHAIYAINNLRYQNRMKVLQTISPLLMDINEDSEVRMAAFIFYLASNPSTNQLHRLIEQERDLDLKTFFVQTLKNDLRTTGTGQYGRVRAQKAKQVLSRVRAFQMAPSSGNFEMRFGRRPEGDGDILNFRWFTNQTSPIPRASTIQHRNIIRGQPHLGFEMGYRAEGFEVLFSRLQDKFNAQQNEHSALNILDSMSSNSRSWKKTDQKPSLTLYLRADGQHVSFIHLDTETLNKHFLEAAVRGQMEIPIRMFQTFVSKPEQNKKLQQTGMWHVTERAQLGVIDVDGTLIIRRPEEGQKMPNISFGSEKMFRHEKKTIISQYVRCGFTKTGVTSAFITRHFVGEQQWNVSYSFHHQNLTFNASHSGEPIVSTSMEAYTNTFVLPMRLPRIVTEKHHAFEDILTHDPDRVTFDQQLNAFKSVELKAQVQGDICVPELYEFVRDRLHLTPTILSIKKQQIKFTIWPGTSSPRNYTFTQAMRLVDNEVASTSSDWPYVNKDDSVERVQKSYWQRMFGGIFSSSSSSSSEKSSSEEIDEITSDNYDPLKELSVGSIRRLWQGRIDSRYHARTLSMVANLTIQHEYDQPTVHSVLSCERPPVPGQERDYVVFTVVSSRDFNPSVNQIVGTHTLAWGEKSDPTKSKVKVTEDLSTLYKDNVCYEQMAYGCKDQYGVFYPLWYNHTAIFESTNTDIVNQTLHFFTPSYFNHAEKVLVWPIDKKEWNPSRINMTRIYRPIEDEIDVAYPLDHQSWNMSRIYQPVESAIEQIFNIRPMYPLGLHRPIASFLPGHEQVDPFFSRDTCVYENTRVMSMDMKEIMNPKTDCEVVLVGDCGMKNKQLMVSLKSDVTDRSVEKKALKVVLGSSKIEIELNPEQSYSSASVNIQVNGQRMYLDSNQQLLVKQQQKTVAVIECSSNQCEVKSSHHGLYVRLNKERVKVEVNNGRARFMCGVCSSHPEIRSTRANYAQAVQIFKNNRNENQQCTIEENAEDAKRFLEQQSCKRVYKHKMISTTSQGQLKTCVTTDKLPFCSRYCEQKMLRFDPVPIRCVDREEAQRLEMYPTMEGNEMYLDNERLIPKMRDAERLHLRVPTSQECV